MLNACSWMAGLRRAPEDFPILPLQLLTFLDLRPPFPFHGRRMTDSYHYFLTRNYLSFWPPNKELLAPNNELLAPSGGKINIFTVGATGRASMFEMLPATGNFTQRECRTHTSFGSSAFAMCIIRRQRHGRDAALQTNKMKVGTH